MPSLMKARSGVLNSNIGGNALAPLFSTGALTIANAITDVTRLAGVEGDGATYPASRVGVWPAATNLCANGGFETNTTGWAALSNSAIAQSTDWAAYGEASCEVTCDGVGTNEGLELSTKPAISVSTAYALQVKVLAPVGAELYLSMQEFNGGAFVRLTGSTNFVGTGEEQEVTFTGTTGAGITNANILVRTRTSPQAIAFKVDGVQLEAGSIATPYIETDGGTASRSAGRITVPASGILTATQGWFIARLKTGFAAAGPGYVPRIMAYGDATDDFIAVYYESGFWKVVSDATGGGAAQVYTSADAGLVVGDSRTIYGGWVSDRVNVTQGTTAWGAGAARTEIPTISSTVIDIGSMTAILAAREAACTFDWVLMGEGVYTAIDPTVVGNWGDNDPLPHMLPRAASPTFLMHANGDGTQYRYAA